MSLNSAKSKYKYVLPKKREKSLQQKGDQKAY